VVFEPSEFELAKFNCISFSQEEHWKVEQFDPAEEMEEEEEEEVLFLDIPPLGFLIPTN
jgi:hypothetical protein